MKILFRCLYGNWVPGSFSGEDFKQSIPDGGQPGFEVFPCTDGYQSPQNFIDCNGEYQEKRHALVICQERIACKEKADFISLSPGPKVVVSFACPPVDGFISQIIKK